jgi:hypothetical protein
MWLILVLTVGCAGKAPVTPAVSTPGGKGTSGGPSTTPGKDTASGGPQTTSSGKDGGGKPSEGDKPSKINKPRFVIYGAGIRDIALSAEGKVLASTGGDSISVWDVPPAK